MTRVWATAASPVVRNGLEAVVRASEVLALAISEEDADAAVAAIAAPGEEELRALSELPCPSLLLTDEPDPRDLTANLRGILRFDSRPEEIVAALLAIAEGLAVMHPANAQTASRGRRTHAMGELDEPLTPREVEVLSMLAEGLSNKLIAHGLNISEHTVKFHVTQIMAKLRASSRTDAVMQGIRRGLVLV